jgi:hypothetical protein
MYTAPLLFASRNIPSAGLFQSLQGTKLLAYLNAILRDFGLGLELVGCGFCECETEHYYQQVLHYSHPLDYVVYTLFSAIAPPTGNPEECQVILPWLLLQTQGGLVVSTNSSFYYTTTPDSSDAFYPGACDESSTVPAPAAEEVESTPDSSAAFTVEARDESSTVPSLEEVESTPDSSAAFTVEARDASPIDSSAPFTVEACGESSPEPCSAEEECDKSSTLHISTLQLETPAVEYPKHVPRYVSKAAAEANGVSNLPEKCYLNQIDAFGPVIRQYKLPKNWGKRERGCLFGRRNTDKPKDPSYDGALDIVDQTGVRNIYVFYELVGDDIHSIDVNGKSLVNHFRVQGDTAESVDEAVRRMLLRVDRIEAQRVKQAKQAKRANKKQAV